MENSIEKVKKLYDDYYYREIVNKGLENVKRFSWDKCREGVVSFYREVLASKGLQIND